MNTWTPAARRALEAELDQLRSSLTEAGADPDEVLEDLRRHVTEEAAASGLTVVTEEDVKRLVARVAPPLRSRASGSGSGDAGISARATKAAPVGGDSAWTGWGLTSVLLCFGVLLPAVTWVLELWNRMCAREILDPLPTGFHVVLVGLVPVVNLVTLLHLRRAASPGASRGSGESGVRRLWILNGAVTGIAAAYALIFLPLTPLAVVGVIFGVGLLALAPLSAFVCGWTLRLELVKSMMDRRPLSPAHWWAGCVGAWVVLVALAVPGMVTRHWMHQAEAGSDRSVEGVEASPADAHDAVRWLRDLGDRETLLRACYGRRSGLWDLMLPKPVEQTTARELYYRVTGTPFNAVPAPSGALGRANRLWFEDFDGAGAEWDSALGGEAVAGRVRGLSLQESRMDALCDADEGWSYVEWSLEFRNDHERSQREARAQIQLPPGGVVSRLTLWVNGEEREAAFAGRGQVREAYRKVAVQQRRDPVLVTTCGPDRILVQCFPIAPGGGTMRVRLGVTAPMQVTRADEAVLTWPRFLERNFALGRGLEHQVWLESPQSPKALPESLGRSTDATGRAGWHGRWRDGAMADPRSNLIFTRQPAAVSVLAPDRQAGDGGRVRQRWVEVPGKLPRRIALVLDGSVSMTPHYREVAAALEGMPAGAELGVFVAQDGVQRLYADRNGAQAADNVRRLEGRGGQDCVSALVQAWEWASTESGGAVLWVHGPQSVLLDPAGALRQRLEWRQRDGDPVIYDLQVRLGPDRVAEALDGLRAVERVPRNGTVRADLESLFAWWAGRVTRWEAVRERLAGPGPGSAVAASAGGGESMPTSAFSHVTRLWALDEIRRLVRERRVQDAVKLGGLYQLVTGVTGAVVLETQQQFTDAGLQPVDPMTVPVVPEPGVFTLLTVGLALLLGANRRSRARRGGPGS